MTPTGRPLTHGLTRRRLFKVGVGFGAVALAAGGGAAWLVSDRPVEPGRRALSVREAEVVYAIGMAHFPPGNPLGLTLRDVDVVGGADAFIAGMLDRERRLVRALLTAFDQWPRLSLASSSSFSNMRDNAERIEIFRAFEESEVAERRLVGALLRTLVGIPFFEDPRALAAIGFEPGCAL
jgi:hypothetical protein